VVIAVEDSGPGVAANLRARIFDPFFTTKPDAIGIGLTLARQAVVAHAGHIELTGSSFGGTLFRVVLPAAEAVPREASTHPPRTPLAVAVAQAAGPSTAAPAARARILWIDDDEVFLRGVKRMLGDWDIHTAFTAKEAEELLARESGAALVFCDVGLPDGSGHLVHARLRETDEGLASRFVFVTGGVITPEVADYLIASGCPTLLKPVRAEEIRALLEGSEDDDAPTSARTLRDAGSGPPPGPTPNAPTVQPRPDAPTVQPRADAPTVRGAGGARGADGTGQQRAAVTVPQRQFGRAPEPTTDAPTRREREITDARAEAEQTAPVRRPDDTSPDGRGRRR
jgi:CheY-like chemotaxis protein